MNVKFILHVFGVLSLIEGGLMILPVIVALMYGEHDLLPILYSSAIAVLIGGSFLFFTRGCSREITKREGHVIVCMVWIVFAAFGSLPYILSGYIPSFSAAFFEAMSGFTTTGSTAIANIEALPHGLLFWRALTHFIGGIGILVLSIAILPIFGTGSMAIYQAEASAATIGKLSPRIKDTAEHIFRIYLILTIICAICYLPDMSVFDAICHAFSTMSSGGFSTHNASMGVFSIYTQYITIFFMLLSGINFTLLFYVWKRDFGKFYQNDELRYYLLIVLLASLFICIGLIIGNNYGIEQAIRNSLFHVVSIITTTGYAISDYTLWAPPLWFILFLITFIGGCAGSTSGGLKVVRFLLLSRMIPVQIKKIIHQRAIIQVKLNKQNVSEERMFRTLAFFVVFLCVYTLGTFTLMICGLDFSEAAGAAIASLGNSGPGLGSVGPVGSFANVSAAGKWTCSILMLFGRLELYTILILLSPAFWKQP